MEIRPDDLKKEISNSKRPILVEFWSSWCLPCQAMKSILEELEKEYQKKMKIFKINADLNPSASSQYSIKGLPTLVFFKGGKEIKRLVGAKSKKEVLEIVEGLIG